MKSIVLTSVILTATLMFSISISASQDDAKQEEREPAITAGEALAEFFDALRNGDVDAAVEMTEPVADVVPAEAIHEYYAKMAQYMKEAQVEVVAYLQLENTAVAVYREGGDKDKVNLDPAYLVRTDGEWRVMFRLTRFDRDYHKVDDAALARFKRLQKWYEGQESAMKEMMSGDE